MRNQWVRQAVVVLVPAAVVAVIAVAWLTFRYELLPSTEEGAAMLVADASLPGETGVTATCEVVGADRGRGSTALLCRMRDPDGRYGVGRVWIGTKRISGYRGTTEYEVLRRSHDFPLSADGTTEFDVDVRGTGPGPTDPDALGKTVAVTMVDALLAAGYDGFVLPECPPVAPGGTVRCVVEREPVTVEVTRPGPGAEHHVRVRLVPRP